MRACVRLGGYFLESLELFILENVFVKKSFIALLILFFVKKLFNENLSEVSVIYINLIKIYYIFRICRILF